MRTGITLRENYDLPAVHQYVLEKYDENQLVAKLSSLHQPWRLKSIKSLPITSTVLFNP